MPILAAPPSAPARILGFKSVPEVGDILAPATSLKDVLRGAKKRRIEIRQEKKVVKKEGNLKQLVIYLKADTIGTLEALMDEIVKLRYEDVEIKIAKYGLGNFTEGDCLDAEAEKANLIGFKVEAVPGAEHLINSRNITFAS